MAPPICSSQLGTIRTPNRFSDEHTYVLRTANGKADDGGNLARPQPARSSQYLVKGLDTCKTVRGHGMGCAKICGAKLERGRQVCFAMVR